MSDKLEDLKQEATELGIKFSANIGEAKLKEKIEEYYAKEETSNAELLKAVQLKEQEVEEGEAAHKDAMAKNESTDLKIRKLARDREALARKTRVITIVDNDQRVNNQTTSIPVSCSNMYFEISRILPLNTPVEVEQALINGLKEVQIPHHVRDAKSNLSSTVLRPRFSISYEDVNT